MAGSRGAEEVSAASPPRGNSQDERMTRAGDFSHVPIIDVRPLVEGGPSQSAVAAQIGEACRQSGFFYVVGHGVDEHLQQRLRELSRRFFAQDVETKMRV